MKPSKTKAAKQASDTPKPPGAQRATPAVVRSPAKTTVGAGKVEPRVGLSMLKYFYWIELGIRSYLRARNNPEFSRAEGLVIASVMLGYTRPSDIARQLGVSRQAIHVSIGAMKEKGIIDLVPDPDDGRIKQVVLTKLASKMNEEGVVAMNLLWQELARRLGKADLNEAAKVLMADWGPPVVFEGDEQGLESSRR